MVLFSLIVPLWQVLQLKYVILVSQSVLYSLWREIYSEITPCKADADFILDSYQR